MLLKHDHPGDLSDTQNALTDVLRYIRNYSGAGVQNGLPVDNYRFSDEREWRYVPPYKEHGMRLLGEVAYNMGKHEIDAEVEPLRLGFEPNDIKYVIIKSDDEISEFVEHLRKAKGGKYSRHSHEFERLTTRILTTEQIMSDI